MTVVVYFSFVPVSTWRLKETTNISVKMVVIKTKGDNISDM